MSRRSLALVFVAGCGFRVAGVPSDALDAPPDHPSDVARDTPPPPNCIAHWLDHTVAFSAVDAITPVNLGTSFERDPFVTLDLLTLYFASDRAGSPGVGDIYAATRVSASLPFGIPAPVAAMSSSSDDSKVSITDDGQIAVLGSDRANGQGSLDVWYATSTGAGTFGTFAQTHMSSVNDNGPQYDPEITANGLHLYLAPSLGGTQRIALATRGDRSSDFSAPAALTVINSGEGDADPTVSPDERVIVFSSRRSGGQGGSSDLYVATRASADVAFDPPFKLTALNTNDDENDPMLSHDGCHVFFSRHLGGTNWDLFEADVTP